MKNPNWIIDELILALDLYFAVGRKNPGINNPAVKELSILLNKFWANEITGSSTLRNENGVRMKTMNFMRLDPNYTQSGRVGLSRGSKLEEIVWEEYSDKPDKLSAVARTIRDAIRNKHSTPDTNAPDALPVEEVEAIEGKILSRIHRQRERNLTIVKKKKEDHLKRVGRLTCEACGFDFHAFYGERGEGIIECHHIKPLSELTGSVTTKLEHLALLCSNCHKIIHAKKPWLTTQELKEIISNRR